MLSLVAATICLAVAPSARWADSLDVHRLPRDPVLDGRADDREYGSPALRIRTPAGAVRVWIGRRGGYVHIAAVLPDSTFYWGDDFVVSLDPAGAGGAAPARGDRQWYLRRVLDSSVVTLAADGRWSAPGHEPARLGGVRHDADWDVASTSSAGEWTVELRVRLAVVQPGDRAPRIAFRTYNDRPEGWWTWPAAVDVPAQRVERTPALWTPLRLGSSPDRGGGEILGRWRGSSICVKVASNAACNDESVIYRFARSPAKRDRIELHAEKVVAGAALPMYDLEFDFDSAGRRWSAEFTNARVHILWEYRVTGDRLTGRLLDLPTGRVRRNVRAARDSM